MLDVGTPLIAIRLDLETLCRGCRSNTLPVINTISDLALAPCAPVVLGYRDKLKVIDIHTVSIATPTLPYVINDEPDRNRAMMINPYHAVSCGAAGHAIPMSGI